MTARIFAWVFVLGLVWGVTQAASKWSGPWSVPVSPIMAVLPDQPDGCGKDCK